MGTAFKIEHGIPVPDYAPRGATTFPFAEMKVGDSFLVPAGTKRPNGKDWTVTSITHSWRWTANKKGMKFSARTLPDGVRVWRIS